MKKIFVLLLTALLIVSLVACGGNVEDKPSDNIEDIGNGGVESDGEGSTNTDIPDIGEIKVETKADRIVTTMNDGIGSIAVTEYIYKDGALSEIIMTMQCADSVTAKTLYDTYTAGSMQEEAERLFDAIKLDGKNVVYTYNESHLSVFSGMSMEQLAASLEGGEALPGGGTAGGNSDVDGDPEVGETVYNYAWGTLNLPDGFPELAEGVTTYIEVEGGAMLSWNAMTLADLQTIIEKMENWSGLTIEKTFEADGAVAWSAENDKMVITVNYWPDAIDMQVSISIQEF